MSGLLESMVEDEGVEGHPQVGSSWIVPGGLTRNLRKGDPANPLGDFPQLARPHAIRRLCRFASRQSSSRSVTRSGLSNYPEGRIHRLRPPLAPEFRRAFHAGTRRRLAARARLLGPGVASEASCAAVPDGFNRIHVSSIFSFP